MRARTPSTPCAAQAVIVNFWPSGTPPPFLGAAAAAYMRALRAHACLTLLLVPFTYRAVPLAACCEAATPRIRTLLVSARAGL
jgi:hypothetical protein